MKGKMKKNEDYTTKGSRRLVTYPLGGSDHILLGGDLPRDDVFRCITTISQSSYHGV